MARLTEQQAKQILFNAQTAAYPNRDVPALLAPLYEYIEQTEAQLNEEYIDENGTGWNRPTAEAYYRVCKAREKWQAKAEQAQADNATLVGVLKSIHRYIHPHNSLNYSGFIDDLIDSIKDTPHPGDPIRQELEQLRAVRDLTLKYRKLNDAAEQLKDRKFIEEQEIDEDYFSFLLGDLAVTTQELDEALTQAKDGTCLHQNIKPYHDNSIYCEDCNEVIWQGKTLCDPYPEEYRQALSQAKEGK